MDDVAVLPSRPGHDLVMTKDAMVAGVHFLSDDPLDLVARKLLRTNLSDLAAKGAEPFGYLLMTSWPHAFGWNERERFARGLAEDGAAFDLDLLGGDTVSTPGPLTVGATLLGWSPAGGVVRRGGARPGDVLMVSGVIGDGWLGLQAAQGLLPDLEGGLARRYRLPTPRLGMRRALRDFARAAADVSDGLLADAGHLAAASGCGVRIDLERVPLSAAGSAWASAQPDKMRAMAALSAGGDDYEVVCALAPDDVDAFRAAAGVAVHAVGQFVDGAGVSIHFGDDEAPQERLGWRHGGQG
jgi:thiamine-monophosphate kinase